MDTKDPRGILYLVATPIGNLEDMTFRAVRILKEADLIAAEDTRNSIRLLNHFNIDTKMTSYHEYNRYDKAVYLVNRMLRGDKVALITDAGTPGISDPGEELVRQAMDAGIPVTALPGACACIDALALSGQSTRRFVFEAFLPHDKKERDRVLQSLEEETRTIVLYEAPHRLKRTLAELETRLGNREVTLCRELTKKFETVTRSSLAELLVWHEEHEPRGEYVLVLAGRDPEDLKREQQNRWKDLSLEEHMNHYLKDGISRKEAMKKVAADRGMKKREVYQALLDQASLE